MKYNIIFLLIFISVILYADIEISTGRIGATRLGIPQSQGCRCHSMTAEANVKVRITGPDTLQTGETGIYRVFLSGGPAVAGGFNAAARYGLLNVNDINTVKFETEITHNSPLAFNSDTLISWSFLYTAPDSSSWDTIYSVALSINFDTFQDSSDKWNFSPDFPVRIESAIPVELISLNAKAIDNDINLSWQTASETNNKGFEILRKKELNSDWKIIDFVSGNGTIAEEKYYTFIDKNLAAGKYYYKLKQIDFSSSFEYSDIVEAEVNKKEFLLKQNYPNPFNPSTLIEFIIPFDARVTLKLLSITGEEINTFSEENYKAGTYSIKISSEGLASGIYIYTLTAENGIDLFSQSKKMIVMK